MSDMTELLTLAFQEVSKITAQRDEAIKMLAEWCVAVDTCGSDWDDWDEHYKNAAWRPCGIRELIDSAVLDIKNDR